jgi:hypothetical protein
MGRCRGMQSPKLADLRNCHTDCGTFSIQDTFVVGCQFSDKIIYPETFAANPDSHDQIYSTEYGIYQPHCGLDNVMLSWGHDEVGLMISHNPPSGSLMHLWHSIYTMSSRVSLPSQRKASQ